MFVCGGQDLTFFDALSHEIIHRKSLERTALLHASWSRDNKYLVYLAEDKKPIILACRHRNNIRSIAEVNLDVRHSAVTFPRTTKKNLAIGTQDGDIFLYNTKPGTRSDILFEPFEQHERVRYLDYNASDRVIAAASVTCVRIYDSGRGQKPEMTRALPGGCAAMRFHPQHGHTLVMGGADGTVMCLDVTTNSPVYEVTCHRESVEDVAFSHKASSKWFVTVAGDNKYAIHSTMDKAVVQCGHLPHGLTSTDISDDRNGLLLGTELGFIHQYDLRYLLTPVTSFRAQETPVRCLRYAIDVTVTDVMDVASAGTKSVIVGSPGCNKLRGDEVQQQQQEEASVGSVIRNRGKSITSSLVPKPAPPTTACTSRPHHVAAVTSSDPPSAFPPKSTCILDNVLDRVACDTSADITDLLGLMAVQMVNLQQFIKQEVEKVDAQNQGKWELLMVGASAGDSVVGERAVAVETGRDVAPVPGSKSCVSGGGMSNMEPPGSGDVRRQQRRSQ